MKYWLKNASKIIRNMYGLELMEDGDRWGGYRGSDNHDELNTEPFIMTHPEGMQLGCIKWRVSKKEDEEEDEEEVKAEIMPLPSEENVDIWVKCMAMSDYFGGLPLDKMTPELTLLLAACLGVNELEVYEQIGGDDDEYSRAGMFEMAEEHADISQGRITCVYTDLARILHPSMLEYVGDLSKSWYNVIIKSEMCNRLSNNWQDERYLGLIDKYQKAADDKIAQIKALNKRIKE